MTNNQAYYAGRNSIDDNGKAIWKAADLPELNTPELVAEFKEGQRRMRAEINLSNDTEWDED